MTVALLRLVRRGTHKKKWPYTVHLLPEILFQVEIFLESTIVSTDNLSAIVQ